MFVRLVTLAADPDSGEPLGLFHASQELLAEETLDDASFEELRENIEWFERHLRVPPHEAFRQGRGICWFRPEAQPFVARLWERAHILRRYGRAVRMLQTWDPGLRTYQDEAQVVAIPPRRRRWC